MLFPDFFIKRQQDNKFFYGWIIVIVGIFVAFSSGPGQSFVFSVFIDSMIAETGFSRSAISTLYFLSTAISAVMVAIVSRLADKWGARSNLILIGVVFGISCFSMALSSGILAFYLSFAALRALGQGSLTINATLLVNQWFVEKRGRAIAIMGLGFPLSNAILPYLSRVLIDSFGWREAYGILGILVMILIIPPAFFLLRNFPEDLGLFPDGNDSPPEIEKKNNKQTIQERRVLTSKNFWMLALPLATPGLVVTALIFHQTSILQTNGLSATTAAAIFIVFACSSAITSMIAGFFVERIGPVVLFGFSMTVLCCVCLFVLVVDSVILAIIYAALMGVSGGSQRIVQGIIWANYYGRFGLGKVQGSAMMVGITGAAIGPLPLGLFFDFNGNYTWGILLLTALTIIAFLSIVVLRPEKGLEVKMPNSNPS